MDVWGGIGRGMREFFSGLARGMSSPPEGSKILTFLSAPSRVQLTPTSPKLVEGKFSAVELPLYGVLGSWA
jgi:hypothetical protein